MAAWSILSGAALPAHDAVILGAEGLLGQRLVTLCATETLLMPVPALMAELLMDEGAGEFQAKVNKGATSGTTDTAYLRFHGDGSMALGAGVGAELGVAADAHRLAFIADVPLSPEVFPAVKAVCTVGHRHSRSRHYKL